MPDKICRVDVEHIAKLARLKLSEQEIERYQRDLSAILEYVDQ
ncbi:MAG: aspartyl/glutamyl-tRNA amidotransferase subunit C, partial [Planctomycetes bacterium]|nr:aspartyl/glutamyl-tRNA amidotransferase subunit C [Planctomycetota bacterium]